MTRRTMRERVLVVTTHKKRSRKRLVPRVELGSSYQRSYCPRVQGPGPTERVPDDGRMTWADCCSVMVLHLSVSANGFWGTPGNLSPRFQMSVLRLASEL